jgi:hypothetical protein
MLRLLLALCLAAIGVKPAFAQDSAVEARLVQAFQNYCVATAGEPRLVYAELAKVKTSAGDITQYGSGRIFQRVEILDTSDPNRRLLIGYGEIESDSGVLRVCKAEGAWGRKPELAATVAAVLASANGTSVASTGDVREGEDVTRWTIHLGGAEGVVELRVPTYAGMPGRTLILIMRGQ